MITPLAAIEPAAAPVPLTAAERRELDQWHADRNYVESGDDHAFDYWLNNELARMERRITALEMQLEAQGAF